MTRIQALCLALAMTATPALAQQAEDHAQHHPGAGGEERSTGGAAPGGAAPSPGAQSGAAPGGGGGMMQTMMRNMPDQCRAAMQKMPSSCMPMMEKMMSGMMAGGGMRHSGMGAGAPTAPPASGAAPAPASGAHSDHAAQGTSDGRSSTAPHVSAFNDALEKMHEPMASGVRHENPDIAFARGMVPHHQAAIDMALVVLKYGKDEKMRKLALDVIREQNREIAEMNEWLRLNVK